MTYTVTFAAGEGASGAAPAPQSAAYGATLALPENTFTYAGHSFAGWSDGGRVWQPGDLYQVTRNITLTAIWQAVYEISGNVVQKPAEDGADPAPVPAVVTLMYGGRQVAQTTADANGAFTFGNLVPGVYNLVTTYGEQIVTTMVTITDGNETLNVTLPAGNANSVVAVEDVPVTAVGNLDTVFTDNAANEVYTEADKAVVSGGGTVEITLTASQPKAEQQEDVAALEEAAGSAGVGLKVDLTVTKKTFTIQQGRPNIETSELVSDTGVVLVTRIALPAELQGMDNYAVYRIHGTDEPAAMSRTPNEDGEFFEIDGDTLIIYARKYSLYAVSAWDNRAPSGGAADWSPIITEPEHGDVIVSPNRPSVGNTVTIRPVPDKGYEVDTVTVTDKYGNAVDVTGNGDGTWTFIQPNGRVTITVTFKAAGSAGDCPRDETCPLYRFTDLDMSAWYHDGVHYCLENGLMNGTGDNLFEPNGITTRAQVVTILWRLEGEPVVNYLMDFADVPGGTWYTEAVRWAASEGIVDGYDNGRFCADDAVTREQLAAILYRYAVYKDCDVTARANLSAFTDADSISGYALEALAWANAVDQANGVCPRKSRWPGQRHRRRDT